MRKPRAKADPVTMDARDYHIATYIGCGVDDVDLGRVDIETIKALRAYLLEDAALLRDEIKASPMYMDDARETMREMRAAMWACQIEINRHNAFMKRQGSLALFWPDEHAMQAA